MTIIDSQVHAYEANTPKRPWHSVPNWPDHVTGDEMVATWEPYPFPDIWDPLTRVFDVWVSTAATSPRSSAHFIPAAMSGYDFRKRQGTIPAL